MKFVQLFFSMILFGLSMDSVGANLNIKISEDGITSSYEGGAKKIVLPSAQLKQSDEIANSVNFEVYNISEAGAEHTTFESASGICYGYIAPDGVNVVDSMTNYLYVGVPSEYYGNITGVNLTKDRAKDIQFVPIYLIKDPELLKEIQTLLADNSKETVSKSIKKGRHILSDIVCKERVK